MTNIETGRILPSYEILTAIADLFAVKMDWLSGRTDEPYDDVIITRLESQLMDIKLADNTVFRDIAPEFYLDSNIKKVGFSLFDRANLIFLLRFLKAVIEKHPEVLHKNIDVNFVKSLAKRKSTCKLWSKNPDEQYMQLLQFIAIMLYKSTFD